MMPRVVRRLRPGPCVLALLLTVPPACTGGEVGPPHPPDRLDFPVSVTADPSGELVWVVSGNFDLAWRGAAVLAIDVAENRFVPELAFEVGNFPGPLSLLERDGRAVAGYITSREEDRLYTVSLSGDDPALPEVSCPEGHRGNTILHCPADGALLDTEVEVDGDPVDITVGDDPYSTLIAPARLGGMPDLLLVGGMVDGALSTFALAADGTPRLNGSLRVATGLYGLAQNPTTGRLYASSKSQSTFSVLELAPRPDPDAPADSGALDPLNPYLTFLGSVSVPEPALVRDRARALAISRDGTRLYATYRAPDALVVLDIADDATGNLHNRVLGRVPLCDDPNDIEVVTTASGHELLYVSCFRDDRIEVVDPRAGEIVGGIKVGQGPSDMAIVDRPDLGVQRLYVALFNANAVGVVDIDPASPTYHTEIGEIR